MTAKRVMLQPHRIRLNTWQFPRFLGSPEDNRTHSIFFQQKREKRTPSQRTLFLYSLSYSAVVLLTTCLPL